MSEPQPAIIVGTTVRLNDVPSPIMRVLEIYPAVATARCFWFDKRSEPQQFHFPLALLTRCDPYVPPPRVRDREPPQLTIEEAADAGH